MNAGNRKVVVSYAGGREGPWTHEYDPTTKLSVVRADAMSHFGLADTAEGGNQVVFRVYHGGDRLEDLDRSIAETATGQGALALRLIREVIAG